MGEGSKSKTTKVTSRMPVSALSAECKFKEIILSINLKKKVSNFKPPYMLSLSTD